MTAFRFATMDEISQLLPQGSGLAGWVTSTYIKIEATFGDPNEYPLDYQKVLYQWTLIFDDGTPAWVYPWKAMPAPRQSYRWHIGGPTEQSVDRIAQALGTSNFEYFSTALERFRRNRRETSKHEDRSDSDIPF